MLKCLQEFPVVVFLGVAMKSLVDLVGPDHLLE
jgi:hypothetical protein